MRLLYLFLFSTLLFSTHIQSQTQQIENPYPLHKDGEISARLAKISNRVATPRI